MSDKSKKVDNLSEDPVISGQLWCCISFISPETVKNCNFRGVKVRGVYASQQEAAERAKLLQAIDPDFHIFVGEVGKWLGWDPDPNTIEDQQYKEKELQKLVTEYKKNRVKAKMMEEERKREIIEESVRKEATKASKTKDRLKQKAEKLQEEKKEQELKSGLVDKDKIVKEEQTRLLNNEDEIKKATENLSTVDEKINHLQQMYKEMLKNKK